MALLPVQDYFIRNGILKPVSEFIVSENEGGIYEVIRVEKGVPLFLSDHLHRFFTSAKIAGKEILFNESDIERSLNRLIQKNKTKQGNYLISCKTNLKIFAIPHKYPTKNMYSEGVKCGILHAERENPNAKVFQTSVRQKANELIAENQYYEVLLIDHEEKITEGSRSNIFFIKNNQVITSKGEDVLLGITRQKTIEIVKQLGLNYSEKEIYVNELGDFDAVFITGTSPKILPVKQVEEISFCLPNEVITLLTRKFDEMVDNHVNKFSG